MRRPIMRHIAREEFHPERFVFLGGTTNKTSWRDKLIPMLTVGYFNPIVPDWTPEDTQREHQAKATAPVSLYVVTPKQHGLYVGVEIGAASVSMLSQPNRKLVIVFLNDDDGVTFSEHQLASNVAIIDLLRSNPYIEFFSTLEETADFLNKHLGEPDGN